MKPGIIKFYNEARGFGFIAPQTPDADGDVYFSSTDLERNQIAPTEINWDGGSEVEFSDRTNNKRDGKRVLQMRLKQEGA